MPRVCTICSHPKRPAIDAALVSGTPNRSIAAQYHLTEQAVRRHKADHLPAALAQAQAAEEVSAADKLLAEVERLHQLALSILAKAGHAGDLRTALAGIREARGCLELEAKIRGEIASAPTVNVLVSPDWLRLRAVILLALAPYPEARIALASALVEAEASNA
jgi:hypothetical protein